MFQKHLKKRAVRVLAAAAILAIMPASAAVAAADPPPPVELPWCLTKSPGQYIPPAELPAYLLDCLT